MTARLHKTKLLIAIAYSIIIVAFLIIFIWLYGDLQDTITIAEKEKIANQISYHLDKLNTSITYIERNEKPFLIAKNHTRANEIEKGYVIAFEELSALKKICGTISLSCRDLAVLDSLFYLKYHFSEKIIKASKNDKPNEAILLLSGLQDSIYVSNFISQYNAIVNKNLELSKLYEQNHLNTTRRSYKVLSILILFTLIFVGFTFWLILNQLKRSTKLSEQNQLYAEIINTSPETITIFDNHQKILYCNPATEYLFKRRKEEMVGQKVDEIFNTINTNNVIEVMSRSIEENGHWTGTITRKGSDGKPIHFYLSVNALKGDHKSIPTYFSIATNITELQAAKNKIDDLAQSLQIANAELEKKVENQINFIKEIFQRIKDVFIGTDTNFNITYANDNVDQLFGLSSAAIKNTNLLSYFFNIASKENVKLINDSLMDQQQKYFVFIHPTSKKCYETNIYPSLTGISIFIRDITDAKTIAEEVSKSKRFHEFIGKINDLILNASDENEILNHISQLAVEAGKFRFAWVSKPNIETQTLQPIAWAGYEEGYLKAMKTISLNDNEAGRGPSGKAIRAGTNFYTNDIANDPDMKPWRTEALARGYRASIAMPIKVKEKVEAIFTLYTDTPFYFNDEELLILERVTENIGLALQSFAYAFEKQQVEFQLNKISQAVAQSNASIVITDSGGNIEYVNPAFVKLTGYTVEEVLGQNPRILQSGNTAPDAYHEMWQKLTNKKSWQGIFCNKKKNGEEYWEFATISPIENKEGVVTNYVAVKENITEKRKIDEEQAELISIIENTAAYVGRMDADGNFLYLNQSFRKVLEIGEEENIEKYKLNDFSIAHQGKNAYLQAELLRIGMWTGENLLKTKSGKEIPVLQVIVMHTNAKGEHLHTSITAIDLTKIKESESKLLLMNKELFDLATHLQNISEIEKKQIARDIHDELGQYLTAMKLCVVWTRLHLNDGQDFIEDKLKELENLVTETISSFKRLHSSLHPAMLEEVGLVAAVEWYITSIKRFKQINIEFNTNIKNEKIDFSITLPVYRVIQESLTNALRYSKATQIGIDLNLENEVLILRIQDNGCGFDVSAIDTKLHHGLIGMKERIMAVNGKFSITSALGEGTLILVDLPVNLKN